MPEYRLYHPSRGDIRRVDELTTDDGAATKRAERVFWTTRPSRGAVSGSWRRC